MKIQRHGEIEFTVRAEGPLFTGDVTKCPIAVEGDGVATDLQVGVNRFQPGARTTWHMHTFDQGLVVVEGHGLVGTREEWHDIFEGDIVFLPAREWHFHGASEETAMSHLAISGIGTTTVGDVVDPAARPTTVDGNS